MSEDSKGSKDSVQDLSDVEKARVDDDVNEKEPLSLVVQFAPDDPENPKVSDAAVNNFEISFLLTTTTL